MLANPRGRRAPRGAGALSPEVVHLDRPPPIAVTHAGQAGTLTFEDGVVWRTGDHTERLPLDRLVNATASYSGHVQTSLATALGLAMVAMVADLPVWWGVAALWLGAGLRLALDRLRPSLTLTFDTGGEPRVFTTADRSGFRLTQVLRGRMRQGVGESSFDEMLHDALANLRSPVDRKLRRLGAWNAFWLVGFPLLVWLVLFVGAFQNAWLAGEPVGETFVVLAMGPPFSVILWPVSGLFGLLLQAPLAPLFARWANRP